ncbi:endonuclease/exonuclease/phosphatase family protein [Stakelama tenebrarum]|uniref:Endonuclease n=1 Tax=Stakelama tenebrarum TaxID=2711215 RepID=A0A6G6Y5W2_9SPHN|nr:endonuclease/exonuclease/phosphatase family protein [Sphingosinithalassobacter tenebrarum]QIG80322.1 endonuclease [Sphingosinithalassobacter tenebrarum]
MIKVASYNMRKAIGTDRRRRPERTLHVLSEIGADIVALQEADRRFGTRDAVITPHLLEEHSDWKPVPLGIRAASMGWHGNALLVPKDAQIVDCEAIHLPALEPRGAVMADVRVRGTIIRVVGMHLDLSGLWRRRQAHAIIAHVAASTKQYPTVLMGDLNEWSSASGCLRDFGRDYCYAEIGPSYHARRPIGRLDRIMVSDELRIADCGVHHSAAARTASDHLPVWAELKSAK